MDDIFKGVNFKTCCVFSNVELQILPENLDKFEAFCIDLIKNCNVKYFLVQPVSGFDYLIYGILKAIKQDYGHIIILDKFAY